MPDMLYSPHKIPFGLKDGRVIHIADSVHGKGCGCICMACGHPLIASNKRPRKVAMYFKHDSGSDCAGALETALHRAAKEALLRHKQVLLPALSKEISLQASDGRRFSDRVKIASQLVTATEVLVESWQDGIRPDVVFTVNDEKIFIEIKVTHGVPPEKAAAIEARNLQAIEIDVAGLPAECLVSQQAFDEAVCALPRIRRWIYCPEIELAAPGIRQQLESFVAAHEKTLQRLEALKRKHDENERERHSQQAAERRRIAAEDMKAADTLRRLNRARLKEPLDNLARFQLSDTQKEWAALMERHPKYQSRCASNLSQDKQNLLFVPLDGEWVFECRRQDWQGLMIDLLVANATQARKLTEQQMITTVMNHAVTTRWVIQLLRLKQAYLANPETESGQILKHSEAMAIPNPASIIGHYLQHLAKLGLLQELQRWVRTRSGNPVSAVLDKYLAVQQSSTVETNMPTPSLSRAGTANGVKNKALYLEAVMASERRVSAEFGGTGRRCQKCFLLNAFKEPKCIFCGGHELMPFKVTADYLSSHLGRLRSNPAIYERLDIYPSLNLESLAPYSKPAIS